MKAIKCLAFVVIMLASTSSAWAGGRVHFSFFINPFGFYAAPPPYPYYYPEPYYAQPPVIINNPPPVYYVEPPAAPVVAPAPPSAFWYYCADSRAYYPYVKNCPNGWQRVAPQP